MMKSRPFSPYFYRLTALSAFWALSCFPVFAAGPVVERGARENVSPPRLLMSAPETTLSPTTATLRIARVAPSAEVLAVLKRLEAAHGDMKTVEAEFDQIITSEFTGSKVKSKGVLFIQMPDRLRLEYFATKQDNGEVLDRAVLLYVNNSLYNYAEKINTLDQFEIPPEEFKEKMKMLMLGFGASSQATLESYNVTFADTKAAKPDASLIGLVFEPTRPEVRKEYKTITVWFDKAKLWPQKIRMELVSLDIQEVTINTIEKNGSIKAKVFEPKFAKFPRREPKPNLHPLPSGE